VDDRCGHERAEINHQHYCHVSGHSRECEGKALRGADTEQTVCICLPCGRPIEGFDHSGCKDPIELIARREHTEEECRSIEEVRKQNGQLAAEPGSEDAHAVVAKAEVNECPAEMIFPEKAARPFERSPLVPIEPGDPVWHCDRYCHCGCRRMPPELDGGFCFHCCHVYQRNEPEFWLGEEFPHSEAAHLKNCVGYQEYHRKTGECLAEFQAMIKGADDETFSSFSMPATQRPSTTTTKPTRAPPEGSPERATIIERIAIAHSREISER
jgi:hypothetical protein